MVLLASYLVVVVGTSHNPLERSSTGGIHPTYRCLERGTPFTDDFEEITEYWLLRGDGVHKITVENSLLILEVGPTEALYYSNAEVSDGDFNCLRWWGHSIEFKARYRGSHYGSWGVGFWNYSMVIDRSMPLWFIYLRSVDPSYPLNGFYIQAGRVFTPIKYFTGPPLAVKLGARLLKPLLPIKFTSLKPVKPDLDLESWHVYRVEWSSGRVEFLVDGELLARVEEPSGSERFRVDAWIDNAVFTPLKNDYARVYRHVTHENRAPARLELDYVKVE